MRQTDERYLARLRARHSRAKKKDRGTILDEFVKTTGYHRKYAIRILRDKRQRAKRPVRCPRRAVRR